MSRPLLIALALWPSPSPAQKPVISAGGVVNAASYSALGSQGVEGGSVASIFGSNLAASSQAATTVPLPTSLAGTSVTVNGVAVPLFFVSPTQINFQMPSPPAIQAPTSANPGLVVTTAAGSSEPYDAATGGPYAVGYSSIGIFTLDASGCGRGDILNVASDGTLSLNSPANSVSPGQYLATYGTGLGLVNNSPPDGYPAPSSPLAAASFAPVGVYDFLQAETGPYNWWAGRAPGLIGVDQFNLQVPATGREGCAVPFQVQDFSVSQPVTISIRNGGGPCVDPPEAGYGQITWTKAFSTSSSNVATEADTVTVSVQESPGKQAPPPG